jgi:hypothetical protein
MAWCLQISVTFRITLCSTLVTLPNSNTLCSERLASSHRFLEFNSTLSTWKTSRWEQSCITRPFAQLFRPCLSMLWPVDGIHKLESTIWFSSFALIPSLESWVSLWTRFQL